MPDAGYLDEDGYLHVCDRVDDTIIVAGQNIYPAEVEKALAEHPAVADAAVIGIPDERWGQAVKAIVVLHPGERASGRDLMLSLRGRIADFKIPTSYDFADSLPRNPTGKILRRTLREQRPVARTRTLSQPLSEGSRGREHKLQQTGRSLRRDLERAGSADPQEAHR